MRHSRRAFLNQSIKAGAAFVAAPWLYGAAQAFSSGSSPATPMFFDISLAQWSLHKTINAGKITNLDFPGIARTEFGIGAVEYVNQFFADKAEDAAYLADLNKRAGDHGVRNVLIMIDGEGGLADTRPKKRLKAIENHYKWVEAAKTLGCHSIRVNCYGEGTREEVAQAGAEGLAKLSEFAEKTGINIIVENHGGYSSDGEWMAGVMKAVNKPNCGMLPDFGNFCIERNGPAAGYSCKTEYDRYKGVELFMPYAKGVSAKSHDFDAEGNEVHTDYLRMLKIVKDAAGYKGYIGIEYEGEKIDEYAGIRATKVLLERVGATLG
ncbi:MAG: sugar phosphate isomerase/epimerase [Bacteroidetes bacterium]|nr:MAG: sugar phosphate isomerase/epimerase [Bacteroidota bacterium]